ncbi:MAG: prolyl-tRNA synthetase associated domain-containing protein [Salaquimonas sp.]
MKTQTPISKPAKPQELLSLLDELGMKVETHKHEAVFTVEESDHVTASIPGGHTKNLFLKDKKGNFFLIIAGNKARISLNKIHSLIGASGRVSFANADYLMEHLGVKPGSVNAFAPMNDHQKLVNVIIDKPLLENELINCHPLINEMTTTISREDLLKFLEFTDHNPMIIHLSEISETEI